MGDIFSVLSSSYSSAALTTPSKTKYVNVDPALYKGRWEGNFSNGQKMSMQIMDVNGFRARVKYDVGGTVSFREVLIKDGSFRIDNTKFVLTGKGKAQVRTVVSNPIDGSNKLVTANVTQS